MSKQTVEIRNKLYQNGQAVSPFIPDLVFADSMATPFNLVSISGSAINESLAISDIGTVVDLELRVAPVDVDKITVKYNGGSDTYPVSPIEITSENITAITATNVSTSAVNLYWRPIYQ